MSWPTDAHRGHGRNDVLRRRPGGGQSQAGGDRLAEGKLPLCAEMCATKALLGCDGDVISAIYRERVVARGSGAWGWGTAYQLKGGA